jgi:hypothetical protein
MSHNRTVPSRPHEKRREESEEKATAATAPSCPLNVFTQPGCCCAVSDMSHTRMQESALERATGRREKWCGFRVWDG